MSLSSETFAVLPDASHSNAALVNRFRQRDESAFTEIFERHRHLVYRVCLRYVGHHHDAEDITQETFRRAAQAMPSVDSQRPLEPWLVTIAANRCRSFLSRRKHDRRVNSLHEVSAPCGTEPDSARRLSLSEQLDRALDRLPAEQRRAFELVHQQECSYLEAAREMDRPLGTIKTWVRRAKQDLQDTLLAADAPDVSMQPGTPASIDAPAAVTETARATAKNRGLGLRRGAVAFVASVVLVSYFGIPRPSRPEISSVASVGERTGGAPASITAPASTTNPLAMGMLDRQSGLAATDWQWVSLSAFVHTRWNADDVDALPLGQWMRQTSPALDHLRSTIKPFESTLHRVAELFQCELAQIAPPTGTTLGQPRNEGPDNDSSVIDAARLDELGSAAAAMTPLRCSIS